MAQAKLLSKAADRMAVTSSTSRTSLKNDPAIALWRNILTARAAYVECDETETRLNSELPGLLRNGVEFKASQHFTTKSIAQKRDAMMADRRLALCTEDCRKLSAEAAAAMRMVKILTAARNAAERVNGAAAARRATKKAERELDEAEAALVAYCFKSPAAIVAGLHLSACSSHSDALDEWPMTLLRKMVAPLLAKMPQDLVLAFKETWPDDPAPSSKKGGAQ
jgi:hypothetical protein